jgi:hypothetical protein
VPDKEWGLAFLEAQRRELRRAFKLKIAHADTALAHDRAPNGEESLLALEHERVLEQARARAEPGLSRPQRRWLTALESSANQGGFFAESGQLNLAAAARVRGKHRSSALRAFDELSRHFSRELEKLR